MSTMSADTKSPTIAQLQEKLDSNLKDALETAAGRPFTEGTVDDFRLDLERRGFKIVDTTRNRHLVDERVYSRACYELEFYRMSVNYFVRVCAENGFDFSVAAVAPAKPVQPTLPTMLVHGDAGEEAPVEAA